MWDARVPLLRMLRRTCRSCRRTGGVVVVERHLEVREILEVKRVAARNQLLRRDTLRAGTDHDWRTVRIVRTHIQTFMPAHLLEPDPEVGLDVLDKMA